MDLNEINKQSIKKKIAFKWGLFLQQKQSTDLWSENDFLYFLDNEDAILNYSISIEGEKAILFKDGNPKLQLEYKQKLDRLREIYNERFKKIEPENNTKFTLPERFRILEDLGLTKSPIYKGLTETGKGHLISKLLGVGIDNAKKIKNGTYPTKEPINENKIDAFFEKYNIKK